MIVIKRNGSEEDFDIEKIKKVLVKAFETQGYPINGNNKRKITRIAKLVEDLCNSLTVDGKVTVDDIQDSVETYLMQNGCTDVAKAYIIFRENQKNSRLIRERIDYMDHYAASGDNAATSSETDANANVTMKNVANLEGEVYKTTNRIIQRQRMRDKLGELYPDVSKQYEKDLNSHIIYTHDEASTPVLKQYCMAVSLYPLMTEGVGNIDGVTPSAPNDLQSFSGQITNLIFLLSSQCKGAVAVGEYFIALNYYIIAEYGKDWYNHLDDVTTNGPSLIKRTVKDNILKAFKQFVWGINQPAGNRSYQSPFTNISYYDKTYFDTLFGDFYYPDSTQPEWKAIDTLQRMFMKWFNQIRLKQVLTFPVETFAMVYDPETNDIIDQNYKDLCAEMYSEGHSFFTYISDSADSLASCCFSGDTKILWKFGNSVRLTTLKELYDSNFGIVEVFSEGRWVRAKGVKAENRKMYRVTLSGGKSYCMTDNHINVTSRGQKITESLTVSDYLKINSRKLESPTSENILTYEMGFVVGAFLSDGSVIKDGKIYNDFPINIKSSRKYQDIAKDCIEQLMGDGDYSQEDESIGDKKLLELIEKWSIDKNYEKHLNMDCILESPEFRSGIIDGWCNFSSWFTYSQNIADSLNAVATTLGLNSTVTSEEPGFRFSIYKSEDTAEYLKITAIEQIDYSGDVYCVECENKLDPYFTLSSGLVTHNCRLRNELAENTFSPTSGLTGVMTGSCNVITLNINRITQDYINKAGTKENYEEGLKQYLTDVLERVYKYHIAYKTMLYDLEDKGMFAASNGGYIYISKLYSTIGINGLNEAARFLGYEVSNNEEYIKFLQLILGTIKEQNKLHSIHDKKRPFLFNSEVVPAEGLGGKNYNWDKNDGYWVPEDENLYNSYFYNAHDDTAVLDKFILHGRQTYQYTDGGSALHCNLEDHLSKEQYLKIIDFAIKNGTSYFTFNIPNSKCEDCGHIIKKPVDVCPVCGSNHITQYTRVIG